MIVAQAAAAGRGSVWFALSGLGGLVSLVTVMWRYQARAQARIDVITTDQIRQLIADRDVARADCARVQAEAETWQRAHTEIALQLARVEAELRLRGTGSSGADPTSS